MLQAYTWVAVNPEPGRSSCHACAAGQSRRAARLGGRSGGSGLSHAAVRHLHAHRPRLVERPRPYEPPAQQGVARLFERCIRRTAKRSGGRERAGGVGVRGEEEHAPDAPCHTRRSRPHLAAALPSCCQALCLERAGGSVACHSVDAVYQIKALLRGAGASHGGSCAASA